MPLHDVAAFGQGDPLAGLVDGGTLFLQSPLTDPERDLGLDPGRRPRRDPRPAASASSALDTAALARRHAPRPDLAGPDAGRRPRRRVPARGARSPTRAGLDRDELLAAVQRPLGRFFGKRGGAVVDANLAVIAAAYDGLIDVTAALRRRPGAGRRAGRSRPMIDRTGRSRDRRPTS